MRSFLYRPPTCISVCAKTPLGQCRISKKISLGTSKTRFNSRGTGEKRNGKEGREREKGMEEIGGR